MTQEQALTPFEGLESFKGYILEERIEYIKVLLNVDENPVTGKEFIDNCNMEGSLEVLAHIRWYMNFLEIIYKYGSPLVLAYVIAHKTAETLDGKFSITNKNIYDFSVNENWKAITENELQLAESRKQLEVVLKKGGTFAGETLSKIKSEVKPELKFSIEK